MNKTVAIILARGGSKGIPGKNLMKIGGKSLIERAVFAAVDSVYIDDVYVSTDSSEIAAEAKRAGAKVIDRPAEHATDTASSESALLHFAEQVPSEQYVFIQCTSPFTVSTDLDGAIELFTNSEHDSLLSVTDDHGGFLCGGFTWNEKGESVNYDYCMRPRRQDMEKTYRENGAFYIMTREGLLKNKNRLHGKVGLFPIPRIRSFEIDEPEDVSLAEHHYEWLKKNKHIDL